MRKGDWSEEVKAVEELYGKDWWRKVPMIQRLLLGLMADLALSADLASVEREELDARIRTKLKTEIEQERSRIITRARLARG